MQYITIRNKLIVNGYRLASWLCWKLPTRFLYALAAFAGEIYYWSFRGHSRHADRNMQVVLGEPEINWKVRLVARRSFRNYIKYVIDLLRQSRMTPQEIATLCTTSGWYYIDAAIEESKGIMFITPHFGNWDSAAAVVLAYGYRFSSVAKDFEPPELNELIQGTRRKIGIKIYSLKDSFRGLYTTLKSNGMVVLLLDSPLQNEGVLVEYFGRPVRMASGPATLVYRTGSVLQLGYIVRQPGNNTYYGCWEPPISYKLVGDRDKDIQIITQAITTAIEKVIRRHPDQWYMFRHLFLDEAEVSAYQQATSREAIKAERRAARVEREKAGLEKGAVKS